VVIAAGLTGTPEALSALGASAQIPSVENIKSAAAQIQFRAGLIGREQPTAKPRHAFSHPLGRPLQSVKKPRNPLDSPKNPKIPPEITKSHNFLDVLCARSQDFSMPPPPNNQDNVLFIATPTFEKSGKLIEDLMTPDQKQKTGLIRLNASELAELNAWLDPDKVLAAGPKTE
jgi:hypothetical protein